ncbi:DUF6515 family protein [Microbulbifer marinus]|uniref:DUF1236 domain-containing protein n=1 Tax=Microbulbifer marinus TaxID=658218 RepID=A0A1H4B5B5_9GAMM|nr:DUF6515 family protein [Microbulbifer marinus]SEA43330.1 hypothetical protein SAMN05216562_3114 [Microbulbifer marinus]
MKTLKALLGALGLLALAAFAFSPPADAAPRGYERGGSGYHHPYKHWKRHHHHGPRYRRGPRISIGFVAPILPAGYISLAVGGNPYYYHGGYFYRPAPSGYVVVSAPLGASVLSLPASAVQIQIGGFTYYQYADAYYQWHPAHRAYVVVPPPAGAPVAAPPPAGGAPVAGGPSGYAPGEVLESLPPGYTAEVINGVQYYRYGNDYFMPTQRDGREVYVVVRL